MTSREEIRLQLTLHYDGSRYFGWQVQRTERTVQGELEAAIHRLTGEKRTVVGAGRTDRGVHATGQVAAVTLPASWHAQRFRKAMNAVLPRDVWLAEAERVSPRFHPRYDASARSYEYRVGIADESASPFHRFHCWVLQRELRTSHLETAAGYLVGEHSFRAFAKSGQPQRGDRCRITHAEWSPWDGLGLRFKVTANRFLHHMVRYLVGTMVDVGRGRRPVDDISSMLDDRSPNPETSPPAPAEGLFLTRVEYPGASSEAPDAPARTEPRRYSEP